MNDSPKITIKDKDGQIVGMIGRAKAKRFVEREKEKQRTRLAVCQDCWFNEQFKSVAHKGAMKNTGKDGEGDTIYYHVDCPMRKNAGTK